jgi:hypothetical protein
MKRKGYVLERIADADNLRLAFWKAQKGKSAKEDVNIFRASLDSNLMEIRNNLLNGTYRCGNYHFFTIYDPKKRVICAASFAERVLHHAIMNVCAQDFENRQIPFSYACRKGKGTFAALEQAARYQKKYSWYLKLDVRKYFDSIDHLLLLEKLKRIYKDANMIELFRQIIDSYHAQDNRGLPIGNLTSQYFANHYLSFADKFATETLHIPAYIRYMDDMMLWANEKNILLEKGEQFRQFINENLRLSLKPFIMNRTEYGLPALGFLIYPNTIRLNKSSRNRYASKMKICTALLNEGKIEESEYARRVLSMYGFISHANSLGYARHILKEDWIPKALTV